LRSGCGGGLSHPNNEVASIEAELEMEDLNICGNIGYGRSEVVYKGHFRGIDVAWKLCDASKHPEVRKEFLNEVSVYCYGKMQDIQGIFIPRLVVHGNVLGGMFYAIGTTLIMGYHPINPSEEERKRAMEALNEVHQHGFLHNNNDIRKDNFLISKKGRKKCCFLIDFGFASQSGSKKAMNKEMQLLEQVLLTSDE
jgi:predicted Ser/Thr protein kinase